MDHKKQQEINHPQTMDNNLPGKALWRLRHPILPLVRMVKFLFLTGPFVFVDEILAELVSPIEFGEETYEKPGECLNEFLSVLKEFEQLKKAGKPAYKILSDSISPMDLWSAVDLWVAQQVLALELERINSLLCQPCKCFLCCIGPEDNMRQKFFEIPLQDLEIHRFPVEKIDSPLLRQYSSQTEPPFLRDGLPFYNTSLAIYHWQDGWSLILPQGTSCPGLNRQTGLCQIYEKRPEVCRRTQIFPYVLEKSGEQDNETDGERLPVYIAREKLLAIWDCPYVRQFQKEIAAYAERCELEPIFKENKG